MVYGILGKYDFIRNPIVQNEVFFPGIKMRWFFGPGRSLEELIEREELHRTQCSPSNAAA